MSQVAKMKKSVCKKTIISTSIILSLGVSMDRVSYADPVASFQLKDFNSDGLMSDFGFATPPPGNSGNKFGAAGETGCLNAVDGNTCDPIDMVAGPRMPVTNNNGIDYYQVLEFTTGFNFGGGGDFNPNIAGDINATIDPSLATAGDGQAVQFGALDFGGIYQAAISPPGVQFSLGPDHLQNCTGAPPGAAGDVCGSNSATDTNPLLSNPLGYNVEVTNLGSGDYGVVVRYVGTITGTGTAFDGNQANWRIEGVMALEDVAPSVTLNGVNPLIVSPDTDPYVDPGATCFDGVDGSITSGGPGVPSFIITDNNAYSPSTGPNGNSFTVTYTCTDSKNQQTVATRTVISGTDTDPPVIALTAANPVNSIPNRLDTPDGTLVRILQNVAYNDLGAECVDNTGIIPFPTTGPGTLQFTVDNDTVDTTQTGSTNITFTCNDAANNGPVQAVRTVTVETDSIPPVIDIPSGAETIIVSPLGSPVPPSTVTCSDSNQFGTVTDIPLGTVGQPGFTVSPDPATINTNVVGDTVLTYTCTDAFNNRVTQMQTISVTAAQTYKIISMSISDVNNDGVAGCFRFESLQGDQTKPGLCDLANRFSSDGSVTGFTDPANATFPGSGTDLDDMGNPIGIRFGSYQAPGQISPGFKFANFPFIPFTFDPPSKSVNPPDGYVNVIDEQAGTALLDIRDFPFSGLYNSSTPNEFILDPDPGTLSAVIFNINNDNDGMTRSFDYEMIWSHRIGPGANPSSPCPEDPTGSFCGNNAFFRLEGKATVSSQPVTLNSAPIISNMIAAQASLEITRIIVASDGTVTVSAMATDPDGDNLTFDWSGSDSQLIPLSGTTGSTFDFNPAGLSSGFYTVRLDVTDDNATNPLTASAELLLNIMKSAPVLGSGDSNGNGIPDDVEGYGDSDDDGIPDYLDAVDGAVNPTRNLRDIASGSLDEVVSSAGRLVLNDTAFKTGRGGFIVTQGDIGVIDRVNLVDGIGHSGGIFDFEVTDLEVGDAVQVVLPQSRPLPVQPEYRKYKTSTGWGGFGASGNNALASAMRVNGECPDPSSVMYDDSIGLVAGDECVRVTIVDGGPNDGDAVSNGVVKDPGTASGNGPVPEGGSGGGGCTIGKNTMVGTEWLITLMFIGGLGVLRRKVTGK